MMLQWCCSLDKPLHGRRPSRAPAIDPPYNVGFTGGAPPQRQGAEKYPSHLIWVVPA